MQPDTGKRPAQSVIDSVLTDSDRRHFRDFIFFRFFGMKGKRAFLGLGSNQGERGSLIGAAEFRLDRHAEIRVVGRSSLYESDAWGRTDQPPFLNQVIEIETALDPVQLLQVIHQIETDLGRERREKWGARTIDIDILLYHSQTVDRPGLRIPHPRMAGRRFVLEPLAEIAPDEKVPGAGSTVRSLLERCPDAGRVRRIRQ